MYTATTYCQDFPDAERYDYGSANGLDIPSFLANLRTHLDQCARSARRIAEIAIYVDGGSLVTIPTNAKPGQLPVIDDVIAAVSAELDHDTEDCPYCDGSGDNRTDPDYSYPMPCYPCGGSGISRVQPPRKEEDTEPTPYDDLPF